MNFKKLFASFLLVFGLIAITNAQKFIYVDTDYILENIPEYTAAQDQLDDMSEDWQEEIQALFDEIETLYKAFQSESVLLPETERTERENEIINKEKEAKDLQRKRFGTNGDLYKKRQELIRPIQDKVYNAIEEVAVEGSFAVVFDKAGSATMLYTDVKYDKSDDVLAKLGYTPGGGNYNE